MCGTLGILGEVSLGVARNALQLLSHRGQDASGLAWYSKASGKIIIKKAKGLPTNIEIANPGKKIPFVVGSTRYPTFGSRVGNATVGKFAQPFESKNGKVVIAHNGNITNIPLLSDKKYESDAEFIADYLGELLAKSGDLVQAVKEFMNSVDGSYAVAGIYTGKLFAFRDPRGIRPLVIGNNGEIAAAASESYVLEFLGIYEWEDVNPGELVVVKAQENEESAFSISKYVCKSVEKKAHCMFEWVYFANPCTKINGKSVYQARLDLGRKLGDQISKSSKIDYDYVVPVPDTSKIAATGIAEYTGLKFREAIIKNRTLLRTFIMPTEEKRKTAADLKYQFVVDLIKGKNLLVVDDSIVRGLTSKKIVKRLRELGANKIGFAVTSPPQKYPCYYGIDFPRETELIAHKKTVEQIREYLGVDELFYQTVSDLKVVLKPLDICTACLTGEYPTPHARRIRELLKEGKIDPNSSHYEV